MNDAQHDARYDLDGGQYDALREAADGHNGLGDDFALACNVEPETDHVHARRIGQPGSGLAGRVVVMTHGQTGHAIVYLAAPQARMFAAHLLNAADDLDGVAHLPAPEIEEPEDDLGVTVTPASTPNLAGLLVGLAALPAVAIARRLFR